MARFQQQADSVDTAISRSSPVRVAARWVLDMIAYLAILSTALAAFAGAPLWVVAPSALVLLTLSLVEHRKLSGRFAAIGANQMLEMATWQSAGNALMATGGAYVLGCIIRIGSGL
jgi:hypothetical protein